MSIPNKQVCNCCNQQVTSKIHDAINGIVWNRDRFINISVLINGTICGDCLTEHGTVGTEIPAYVTCCRCDYKHHRFHPGEIAIGCSLWYRKDTGGNTTVRVGLGSRYENSHVTLLVPIKDIAKVPTDVNSICDKCIPVLVSQGKAEFMGKKYEIT